jgi:hypothetical protein
MVFKKKKEKKLEQIFLCCIFKANSENSRIRIRQSEMRIQIRTKMSRIRK